MEQNKNKSKNKVNNKRRLIIFAIIVVIIIAIFVFLLLSQNVVKDVTNENGEQNIVEEKYVEVNGDTKTNTSTKIKEVKTVDGLEFSNIEMNYQDGITAITADVVNTTDDTINDLTLDVKVVDENGQEIKTIMAYIYELGPKATTQISTSINIDVVNSYDIVITKAE